MRLLVVEDEARLAEVVRRGLIVDAHEGAIGVQATPGGGATFVVELAATRRP